MPFLTPNQHCQSTEGKLIRTGITLGFMKLNCITEHKPILGL